MPEQHATADLTDDARDTVHRLNNLLTTVFVQAEALLAGGASIPPRDRAEAILGSATEAQQVLRAFRQRIDGPAPGREA